MRILTVVITIFMLTNIAVAAGIESLTDQQAKDSYSLGYQLGEGIRQNGFNPDFKTLTQGLQDGLAGNEPFLSPEEIETTLQDLQKRTRQVLEEKRLEQAKENLEKSKAFLKENSRKEGVMVLPSGLQYKILQEGSGESPGPDDTVTVHYSGSFIDGTEFDSSIRRGKPVEIKVNGLIPGWTEALQLMKEGAKWQLVVPPELAYGEAGRGARIPPNSTLVFDVELLSIDDQVSAESSQAPDQSVRMMTIMGRIVKKNQGYVIRGESPREVFRILNPNPAILDELAGSGRTVAIEARIVVGDNVEIQNIDGQNYPGHPESSPKKESQQK